MKRKKNEKQFFEEPDEFPGEETQPYLSFYSWDEQCNLVSAKKDEPGQAENAHAPAEKKLSLFRRIVSGFFSF